jgi:zinc transport system ATP-binding protein
MSGPAITFSHVGLALGGAHILEDVSLTVKAGEVHGLIGPNGGGKTSLLRSLLGEMPVSGTISIAWQDNRTIGYVPQGLDFDRTLPITVYDLMAMICQRRPAFLGLHAPRRAAVDAALARVGLAGKGRRRLGDLSGGERQRVLLAQALIPQPALLVMDEPMTAMDEAGGAIFESILRDATAAGVTVLWVAHDLRQVGRLAHSVTCLNRRVRFDGPPGEVLNAASVAEVFGMVA